MQVDNFPEIGEVLNIHLDKFITFAVNYYGYSGSEHYIMVTWIHQLFLNVKAADSKAQNTNLCQAMNGNFAD